MVQNNKVLTVSYGTFSCTLEGFEDSFDTMKAIAEYFRDLAADDRYFGAEPPQPDAEMLARIAEKEIARQVEARQGDTGIILRAADAQAAAPAVAAAAAAPVAAEPVAPVQVEAETPAPVQEPVQDPVQEEEQPEPVVTPDVVAEDIEEAAPVAEDAPEADAEDIDYLSDMDFKEALLAVEQDIDALDADAEDPAAELDVIADDLAADEQDAAPVEAEAVEEVAVEDEADIVPAADSIAAKLQRIRAVVSRRVPAGQDTEYSEDEHAETFAASGTAALEDAIAEEMDEEDVQAPVAQDEDSLFGDIQETVAVDDEADELMNILDSGPEGAAAKPRRVRARVVKVKRRDLDAAVSAGDLEPVEEVAPVTASSLSDEDEADLLRELAEVEAEFAEPETYSEAPQDDSVQDEAFLEEDDYEDDDVFVEPKPAQSTADEEDVSRLMAAADEKLDDPETSSNRETYSHLRAAVAAAEAERSAGGTVGTHPEADPYREDLASVVRPRRPTTHMRGERSPRPGAKPRPAPLKLVAEQRVDREAPAPAASEGPIRPRRVVSMDAETPAPETGGGFAAYAAEQGAIELHELLEAAASYLSFVEGHEQFSRPQLMNKVRQLGSAEFNREDGLRSFGLLLREGKIEKAGNGRFIASGDIGFQPDSRAAG